MSHDEWIEVGTMSIRVDRLQIRATTEELSRWKEAANKETLSVSTWARRELERAAKRILQSTEND